MKLQYNTTPADVLRMLAVPATTPLKMANVIGIQLTVEGGLITVDIRVANQDRAESYRLGLTKEGWTDLSPPDRRWAA